MYSLYGGAYLGCWEYIHHIGNDQMSGLFSDYLTTSQRSSNSNYKTSQENSAFHLGSAIFQLSKQPKDIAQIFSVVWTPVDNKVPICGCRGDTG